VTDGDGGLDDLFSFREEPVPDEAEPVAKPRSRLAWVARNALLIAVATTVTVAALRAGGIDVSIVLVVAAYTGLRLILLAVSEVAPPPLPKRPNGVAGSGPDVGDDSLRVAVRRWEQNLDRAHNDPDLYSRNVLPVLAELTDERLRLRHGITRATDPRRARELLGDPLWAALHDRGRRTPKARDLETYVDALERL
jgi:hypothetical protein